MNKRSGSNDDGDLRGLDAEESEISSKIHEIERFLVEAPRQAKAREEEQRTVMPPPDDLDDRRRDRDFYGSLSRGEIRNERRSQAKNLLLFLLLIAATAAILLWVSRVIQAS